MTLILRGPSDSARHVYEVWSHKNHIGAIVYQHGGVSGPFWSWSLYVLAPQPPAFLGSAKSKEEAMEVLARTWREWLADTGLREVEEPPAKG